MKVLGLLIVIAIVVMGYCMYNPIVVDSADFTNSQKGKSSSSDCKGPFGIDSQKILNDGRHPEYQIAIVTKIDLEKNDDGTWYVDNCKGWTAGNPVSIFFTSPYPQRSDLKEGDFIGFSGRFISVELGGSEEFSTYGSARIVENISSQSDRCKVVGIRRLSIPSKSIPIYAEKKDFVRVTGVIIALQVIENEDPEPDNPSDYLIAEAVMKCADGKLYTAGFMLNNEFVKALATVITTEGLSVLKRENIQLGYEHVNLPAQDAFGEGDVITVTQTASDNGFQKFNAYYKSR